MTKKQKRKCSICSETGHTKRKCPMPEKIEKLIEKLVEEIENDAGYSDYSEFDTSDLVKIGEPVIKPIMKQFKEIIQSVDYGILQDDHPFFRILKDIGEPAVGALCKAYGAWGDKWELGIYGIRSYLADTGDPRALEVVQQFESSKDSASYLTREVTAQWCENADENTPEYEGAVKYLIESEGMRGQDGFNWDFPSGDKVTEMLITAISVLDEMGQDWHYSPLLVDILDERDWKPKTDEQRAVYLLTKGYQEAEDKNDAQKELLEWGEAAIEPLAELLEKNSSYLIIEGLTDLTKELIKTDDAEKILKFIESDDPAMIQMGVSLLKATVKK